MAMFRIDGKPLPLVNFPRNWDDEEIEENSQEIANKTGMLCCVDKNGKPQYFKPELPIRLDTKLLKLPDISQPNPNMDE